MIRSRDEDEGTDWVPCLCLLDDLNLGFLATRLRKPGVPARSFYV